MVGKPRSRAQHDTAVALAGIADNIPATAAALRIPERTVRYWVAQFRQWGDSDLEAFITEQKRLAAGLYAVEQVESLLWAGDLRAQDRASDYKSVIIAGAVCSTKLEPLGQPKNITPASSGTANPLIVTLPDKAG